MQSTAIDDDGYVGAHTHIACVDADEHTVVHDGVTGQELCVSFHLAFDALLQTQVDLECSLEVVVLQGFAFRAC